MANNTGLVALREALNADSVKQKFYDLLGEKSAGFLSNVMTVVQNNTLLQKADRNSIILAAAQAASLDLSINPNLGLAAIVPFKDQASLQLMRDGWVELCLRTGQFKSIVNEVVYEGELVEKNRFTDTYVFDETKRVSDKPIGVMASFTLTNGYSKTMYWTLDECKKHGLRYSQTFKKGMGLWVTDFLAMCEKTLLKRLLKKYAPKSIEVINKAMEVDQASFTGDIDNPQPVYVDNNQAPKAQPAQEFQEATEVKETPKETKTTKATKQAEPKPYPTQEDDEF